MDDEAETLRADADRRASLISEGSACHPMPGRLTLGLYNSYDPRRFHEAHRRALVRAAPLALAFRANLATFGFPYEELAAHMGRTVEQRSAKAREEGRRGVTGEAPDLRTPLGIARFVAGTTSVAEGGPIVELAEAGRFAAFDFPHKGFPPQLGAVVLTTEHAKPPKGTTARAIARDLADGESQLLIFGLGPQGTPDDVRAMAHAEFDVTGQNQGLETATAMGACVASIAAHAT